MTRKILHIDMDAFFAQVEQRDFPHFRNQPLAVGSANTRGVVAAASYEARKFGVHSAMSSSTAKKKCPHLLFTQPRFEIYQSVSKQIQDIFLRYTDLVEPLSLDEAYLDITHRISHDQYASDIAKEIQQAIYNEINLTASIGVSYNKFLAKIASNINKPFGITVITPNKAIQILDHLPIKKFYGIGTQTAKKMHQLGIKNGYDLRQRSLPELKLHFGKAGESYYLYTRGIDNRSVDPSQETRSVSSENTFQKDIISHKEIKIELDEILLSLLKRLQCNNFHGKTFAIKIRYSDFTAITRSKTFSTAIPHDYDFIEKCFWDLLSTTSSRPIRLIGLTIQSPDYHHDKQTLLELI